MKVVQLIYVPETKYAHAAIFTLTDTGRMFFAVNIYGDAPRESDKAMSWKEIATPPGCEVQEDMNVPHVPHVPCAPDAPYVPDAPYIPNVEEI